jgi:hypothetical protein
MPGKLYGRRAHGPGCPKDEYALSRSNASLAKEVESEEATIRNGRRLFVAEIGRPWGQKSVLRPAHILRIGPEEMSIEAEHPVAGS